MKLVVLCGGFGTRISEETLLKPKPMVEIGTKPILWHILKIYSFYGINEFIICCGYKGYIIKEYFSNYFLHSSDVTFDLNEENKRQVHYQTNEPWKVTLIDTGENSMTGGRIRRVKDYIGNDTFCMTYGDGVADIDIKKLIEHHQKSNKLATITAVHPPARWGALNIEQDDVKSFKEKNDSPDSWINGGFFVLEPDVLDYIDGDDTIWEKDVLPKLAALKQLTAYKHLGFWQAMDTLRDRNLLEGYWENNLAKWKVW